MFRLLCTLLLVTTLVSGPARAGPAEAIAAAVADAARPEQDRAKDANRKPAAVLAFFGVEPGMSVLDMFAGGGYYTELAARVVGERGRVYSQNNKAYRDYARDEIDARYKNNRLANVETLDVEVEGVELAEASVDVVLMVLAYHDLYYVVDDGSWPKIDGPRLLAKLFAILKPGGVLGIVDHAAQPGGDKVEIASRLHRIDEQILRKEVEAAGFVLDDHLDALRNPKDDLMQPMYAPDIRGRTDRFVLRFRKPE